MDDKIRRAVVEIFHRNGKAKKGVSESLWQRVGATRIRMTTAAMGRRTGAIAFTGINKSSHDFT